MKNIIVGIDFSNSSMVAMRHAVHLPENASQLAFGMGKDPQRVLQCERI